MLLPPDTLWVGQRPCEAAARPASKGVRGGLLGSVLGLIGFWTGPAQAQTQWVDVAKLDPTIVLDLRYATANNFLKQKVYPSATCLLRRPVATQLLQVQKSLLEKGYSLKLWDCYRPLSVQKKMWEIVHDSRYVADPKTGSRHNRGAAVDTTLVKKTGEAVEMPTEFDDFSEKADPDSEATWTPAAKANYQILLQAMQSSGFTVLDSEWWHYDSNGWQQYPISNQPVKKH
jgi:zinc D-Ala-D-Ala dipeptidase